MQRLRGRGVDASRGDAGRASRLFAQRLGLGRERVLLLGEFDNLRVSSFGELGDVLVFSGPRRQLLRQLLRALAKLHALLPPRQRLLAAARDAVILRGFRRAVREAVLVPAGARRRLQRRLRLFRAKQTVQLGVLRREHLDAILELLRAIVPTCRLLPRFPLLLRRR